MREGISDSVLEVIYGEKTDSSKSVGLILDLELILYILCISQKSAAKDPHVDL